jgi:tetratricopeptide (TPR) repeat protein
MVAGLKEGSTMTLAKHLIPLALAACAVPAAAAVTVLGSTSARMCYEAADARSTQTTDGIRRCDQALAEENLSHYDMVATLVNRGILRLRMNRLDSAIADFDSALANDPNQAEAYLNKGMAVLRQPNGWDAAVPLFNTALAKRTTRPAIAYYGRAVANELGGRVRAAYFDYREARLEPKWADPQKELARFNVTTR